jgi:hypothetical protein
MDAGKMGQEAEEGIKICYMQVSRRLAESRTSL